MAALAVDAMPHKSAKNASELVARVKVLEEQAVLTENRLSLLEKLFTLIDVEKIVQLADMMPAKGSEMRTEPSGVAFELPIEEEFIAKIINFGAVPSESSSGVVLNADEQLVHGGAVAAELPAKKVLEVSAKSVVDNGVAFELPVNEVSDTCAKLVNGVVFELPVNEDSDMSAKSFSGNGVAFELPVKEVSDMRLMSFSGDGVAVELPIADDPETNATYVDSDGGGVAPLESPRYASSSEPPDVLRVPTRLSKRTINQKNDTANNVLMDYVAILPTLEDVPAFPFKTTQEKEFKTNLEKCIDDAVRVSHERMDTFCAEVRKEFFQQ